VTRFENIPVNLRQKLNDSHAAAKNALAAAIGPPKNTKAAP
jgi:hypothetical protein